MKILYGKSGTMKKAFIEGNFDAEVDIFIDPLRTDVYLTIYGNDKGKGFWINKSFINWDKFLPYKIAEWIATKQINKFINKANKRIAEQGFKGKIINM